MDRMGLPVKVRHRGKSRRQMHDPGSEHSLGVRKSSAPRPPRKASRQMRLCPYRKPTPVGREKAPEVNERPSVKELGKLTPYLWKKGCLSSELAWCQSVRRLQEIGSTDCFC